MQHFFSDEGWFKLFSGIGISAGTLAAILPNLDIYVRLFAGLAAGVCSVVVTIYHIKKIRREKF